MKTGTAIQFLFGGCLSLCFSGCSTEVYTIQDFESLNSVHVGNGITFHPNKKQLLISKPTEQLASNGKPYYRIFQCNQNSGNWSCNHEVSFSSKFTDYHPVFSPDGKWVYFNSDRPVPGQKIPAGKINIWRVSFTNDQWGEPEYLKDINTEYHESYPSIAGNGTLYFNSDRPDGKGSMDIYKSEFINGRFTKPVPIVALNSADSENDLVIDPQERFIIFNRYHFDTKEVDLYISQNQNGAWSKPSPLNSINKEGTWELTPTLAPGSDYFLFEINGKIKYVELKELIK